MRVFVSSVIAGYEDYRKAAKDAVEALDYEAVLVEVTRSSSPNSPQEVCLGEVEDSDVVVILLGTRYGSAGQSGRSPTHEEYRHAQSLGKPILVFVEDVTEREPEQQDFLDKIECWEDGLLWSKFADPISLLTLLVKALTRLNTESNPSSNSFVTSRLPPTCHDLVERLRTSSSTDADRLVQLLSDPASRQLGVLSVLAEQAEGWLAEAGYPVWEAIGEFVDAHALGSSDSARQRAIELGSPRGTLFCIRMADVLARAGNREAADELVARVPPDHPLMPTLDALIADDLPAAVEAITSAGLHESEDPDLARYSIAQLAWAYSCLDRPDLAVHVLRGANQRFPGRAWLLLHQANATFGMVDLTRLGSADSHDLLGDAAQLAIESRDHFRAWDGPSHLAAVVAMESLVWLEDAQRALDIGRPPPDGEATKAEAAEPEVRAVLAHAFLMLGRYADIERIPLEGIDRSEVAVIRAHQARGLGDNAANSRMRSALALAENQGERLTAMFGLASFGEVDEAALSTVPKSEAEFCRGVANLQRGDAAAAMAILTPYRLESPRHAYFLAQAQHRGEQTDNAVATLRDAAEHFGIGSLREPAAQMLFEQGRLIEAASIAEDTLAHVPSGAARRRLRTILVEIAEQRSDWQALESHARAVVREFPEYERAAWAVVYALLRQIKNRQAWGYLVAHELEPFDEATAQLAIAVRNSVDAPAHDAGSLLKIANMYTDSEQVSGFAIAALMAGGDRFTFTDEQRLQLQELTSEFVGRFPESGVLSSVQVDEAENLVDLMGRTARDRAAALNPILESVRHGRLPYGALQRVSDLPYAELLLSVAAGSITAIPADSQRRERERQVAASAIGEEVAVDTSVVVAAIHADLDVCRLATVFQSVLVGDELTIDARLAAARAAQRVDGYFVYDPLRRRGSMSMVDEHQLAATRDRAERTAETLEQWQNVNSGPLIPPDYLNNDSLKPWDASVRVAIDRRCALWCDDMALRDFAESLGIVTFGTWALYESVVSQAIGMWLPQPPEMKAKLLRARVADVPITLSELAGIGDDSDFPEDAINAHLSRPLVWQRDLTDTVKFLVDMMTVANAQTRPYAIERLLYAGSYGLGSALTTPYRCRAIGTLLAQSIICVSDPLRAPELLAASRLAAAHLNPADASDPLEDAVRCLLNELEGTVGPGPATRAVVCAFSGLDPTDRHLVTSIVLGDRQPI